MAYYLNKTPKFIRPLGKDYIWSLPTETPSLYLTFDDGPIPEVTPKVLDILDQFKAKASFFCVADNVRKHPEVYQMIIDKGHSVGNHTYHHLDGWKNSYKNYIEDVELAAKWIDSDLFRPPYGKITPLQSRSIKKSFRIVMWDVLSGDFDHSINAQICLENVIKNAVNGSVIVMHDSLKSAPNMLPALPGILEHFTKKGFEFKAL